MVTQFDGIVIGLIVVHKVFELPSDCNVQAFWFLRR
jgi:hypothetical protein